MLNSFSILSVDNFTESSYGDAIQEYGAIKSKINSKIIEVWLGINIFFLVFCDTISGVDFRDWSNLNHRSYDGDRSFLMDSKLEEYCPCLLSRNHVGVR